MKRLFFLLVAGFFCCNAGFAFEVCDADGGGCGGSYPIGGSVNKICEDHNLSKGAGCSSYMPHAFDAVCMDNKSCAARWCDDYYLLWFHYQGGEYVPYGRCIETAYLQRTYCDPGCDCPNMRDYKCVVNERDISSDPEIKDKFRRGRGGKAFLDGRGDLCHCVKKSCEERFDRTSEEYKCCFYIEERGRTDVELINGKCKCKGDKVFKEGGSACIDKPKTTCEQLGFPNTPDGLKCCKWKTEEHKNVTWRNGKCECEDKNKKINDKGECIDQGGGITPAETKDCYYRFIGYHRCPGGERAIKIETYKLSAKEIEEFGRGSCEDAKAKLQELEEASKDEFEKFVRKVCGDSNNTDPISPNNTGGGTDSKKLELESARSRIDAFMQNAQLNTNVWKNADGQFNTSRLASDLTAGVVLGTVGGIVSANVIKKKQVEKGFDALNCSVGGQKVADWGDEFTVGIRR